MAKKDIGVFQLNDGCWGYRFTLTIDGKKKDVKRIRDQPIPPFWIPLLDSTALKITLDSTILPLHFQNRQKKKERKVPLPPKQGLFSYLK